VAGKYRVARPQQLDFYPYNYGRPPLVRNMAFRATKPAPDCTLIRPVHFAALLSAWTLLALLAGCTMRLPVAELCDWPVFMIAAADRYRCEDSPPEPAIIVPRGTGTDDLA
jgi:hypothetical protein